MSAVDWSAPFEELAPGQAFISRGRTITEADIVGFAALTGDWHSQHADARWAADSRFGERIAHGMLIVSYAVGLVPFDPERVVALRRIADVVFKRPVTIGQTIRVDGKVIELSELGEDGLVALSWSVRSEQALVCRARVEVLWRRDTARTLHAAATVARPSGDRDLIDYPSGVLPC
jgi:3-hydroxybutyryl-CoA dehydratase